MESKAKEKIIKIKNKLSAIDLKFLNSDALKILAIAFMLSDHLWAWSFLNGKIFTMIGRMAFPIFAFQVSEGYIHTKDFKKYQRRLLIFAFISEIPFNLFHDSTFINPFNQNVLFTLWLGLWAIKNTDDLLTCVKDNNWKDSFKRVGFLCLILGASFLTLPDYGTKGMLTVLLFYTCRFLPCRKLFELLGMLALHWLFFEGEYIPFTLWGNEFSVPIQAFALFALIPIWLYNGKKGKWGKGVRYFFYVFYPVHMVLIYVVANFVG